MANSSTQSPSKPNWAFIVVGASSREQVDKGLLVALQRELAEGALACVYADHALSDEFAKLDMPSSRLFIARNEDFSSYPAGHPIHGNVELKLWAGIKMDPSILLLQDVSDRGKFPNSGLSENRKDLLVESFLTGHKVIVGLVASTAEAAASRFVGDIVEASSFRGALEGDVALIYLTHDGEDCSEVLRTKIVGPRHAA